MNQYEFFNTLFSYGKLRDILLFDIFSGFGVLYLKMAKSIDPMHDSSFLTHGSSEGRKGSHCYRSRCCYSEPTCTARVVHFVVVVVAQKPRSQQ